MIDKLEKTLAYCAFYIGIIANVIGLMIRAVFFENTVTVIFNTFATALSLVMVLLLGFVFIFKTKRYYSFILASVLMTACVNFPIMFFTNKTNIFSFYLSMMGSACGLLSIKNWKHSLIVGTLTIIIYEALIIFKGMTPTFIGLGLSNEWFMQNFARLAPGVFSSFTFSCAITSYSIHAFTKLNSKLIKQTETDELTQVSNRLSYNHEIQLNADKITHCAMLDIDNFKRVNDIFGHSKGDFVLKTLCNIISECIQPEGQNLKLYRYGGEEFCLISYQTEEDFLRSLKKIWMAINWQFRIGDIKLTISMGAVNTKSKDINKAINVADKLCYKAKNNGRNQLWYEDDILFMGAAKNWWTDRVSMLMDNMIP